MSVFFLLVVTFAWSNYRLCLYNYYISLPCYYIIEGSL